MANDPSPAEQTQEEKTQAERTQEEKTQEEKTQEEKTQEEASRLSAPTIYSIVCQEGEEEMARPTPSLWWSGVAAGLSISFSLLGEAILYIHLPDTGWRPLVSSLGYTVGFVMVVLARQQLFTENTITAVLPVMAEFTTRNVARLGRIWSIVFAANMAGTLFAALFCSFAPVLSPELRQGMLVLSAHMMENSWPEMFFKGISAGFLIAAMVWLIPSADQAQFHVVTLMTYLIAVSGFVHIVAGSMEAFMLVIGGQLGVGHMLIGFAAPALLGNVIGGTALFSLIAYAQVMHEI